MWPLAEKLRRRRIPVQYPIMPQGSELNLDAWLEAALQELSMLAAADPTDSDPTAADQAAELGETLVIAHSLGTILWGRLGSALPAPLRPTRVLLVAPPAPAGLGDAMATFRTTNTEFGAGAAAGTDSLTVVGRHSDEHRDIPLATLTEGWDATVHELPGAGHLNPRDGHGPWDFPLEWILDPQTPPRL